MPLSCLLLFQTSLITNLPENSWNFWWKIFGKLYLGMQATCSFQYIIQFWTDFGLLCRPDQSFRNFHKGVSRQLNGGLELTIAEQLNTAAAHQPSSGHQDEGHEWTQATTSPDHNKQPHVQFSPLALSEFVSSHITNIIPKMPNLEFTLGRSSWSAAAGPDPVATDASQELLLLKC